MSTARDTRLRKVGNSVGVTLTREELAAAGMDRDQPISITVEPGVITIRTSWKPVIFSVEEAYALVEGNVQSGPGADAVEKLLKAGRKLDGLLPSLPARGDGDNDTK